MKSFVNQSPLSLREFVFFGGCDGETIKKRREYLVMAGLEGGWKEGKVGDVFSQEVGEKDE